MGILQSLFGNRAAYVQSHIAPMMAMMLIDGHAADKEKRVIFARLNELGVTPQELEQLVKNPPPITIPPTKEDRLRAIFEVCLVMLADGKVDEREMALTVALCSKFGLTPQEGTQCLVAARELSSRFQPGVDLHGEIERAFNKIQSGMN